MRVQEGGGGLEPWGGDPRGPSYPASFSAEPQGAKRVQVEIQRLRPYRGERWPQCIQGHTWVVLCYMFLWICATTWGLQSQPFLLDALVKGERKTRK